jgi:hypothetical protein
MAAKFKRREERGGTAAALMALNEIPLRNEIVIEADSVPPKMKVGDGVTHYNDLPYLSSGGGGGGGSEPSDGNKGAITVTGTGTTWNINADAVTNTKLANMATKTYKGRTSASTGDPEDVTAVQLKTDLSLPSNTVSDLAAKQPNLQYKDEGTSIGTSGGVSAVNFAGAGVTATHSSGTVTVTIPGGGGGGGGGTASLENDYSGDFSAALTAIGSTPTTLAIDVDSTLSVPKTVAATIKFRRENDAKITLSSIGALNFAGKGIEGGEKNLFAVGSLPAYQWINQTQVNLTPTNSIAVTAHGYTTGQQVRYSLYKHDPSGVVIGGLTDNGLYYLIRVDANNFKLATSYANALAGTAIDAYGGRGRDVLYQPGTPRVHGHGVSGRDPQRHHRHGRHVR